MINIYFRKTPVGYKWIPGDRHLFRFIKRLFRIRSISGIEKVYVNLCQGFDELKIPYTKNKPFNKIGPHDAVIVLGDEQYSGRRVLEGYSQPNKIIAGIGLMTHPSEWTEIFDQFPIALYLQHCYWANNLYIRYFGDERCAEWPAGIETDIWKPAAENKKDIDVLIYNKIRWDHDNQYRTLRDPIINDLKARGVSFSEITYGQYLENDFYELLKRSKSMIFLCEHETQGFACCQAMSMDVPVYAWNPGLCKDPNRFLWNDPVIETSSVPFFEERCGMVFKDINEYHLKIQMFLDTVTRQGYNPRAYILQNLTLKKSALRMLELIQQVYPEENVKNNIC